MKSTKLIFVALLTVLLASVNEQTIAGAFFLHFADKIYFWDGVALPDHYKLNASNLLQWSIIEWAANNGYRHYDMLGANIPSIARFKLSFGGELTPYIYVYRDLTSKSYLTRKLYGWVMPHIGKARYWWRNQKEIVSTANT